MAEHKRRSIGGDGESTQISLRLTTGLLDRIEAACQNDSSFTGRAHYIDSAIRSYLDTIICPKCGKRINKDFRVCPFCETRIKDYDEYRKILEKCLEDINNYVETAANYLKLTTDLEKDFQNHVKERPKEERDFISKSPELILIRRAVRQTCEQATNYLGIIDRYNNLSIEELRQTKMEEDIIKSITRGKNTGVSMKENSQNTERDIFDYVLIKRKYDKNKHLDNIGIHELENDIHFLEIFGLSARKIAQEIEMNYNSFKMVDSYLTSGIQ